MISLLNIVAQNIKLFRVGKQLSQKEVALHVGIPQGQYSRIENAKVEPSLSTLEKITTYFGVPMAELFQVRSQFVSIDADPVDWPLREKIKFLDSLEEEEQSALLTLIDMAITKKILKDSLADLATSDNTPTKTSPTFNAVKFKTKGYKFDRNEANAR